MGSNTTLGLSIATSWVRENEPVNNTQKILCMIGAVCTLIFYKKKMVYLLTQKRQTYIHFWKWQNEKKNGKMNKQQYSHALLPWLVQMPVCCNGYWSFISQCTYIIQISWNVWFFFWIGEPISKIEYFCKIMKKKFECPWTIVGQHEHFFSNARFIFVTSEQLLARDFFIFYYLKNSEILKFWDSPWSVIES
jgi:hypothetical protein